MPEWTVETLKKHFDSLRKADQKAVAAALASAQTAVSSALVAAEKAVDKAERAAERRFESVNEFRGALTDQTATLLPRAEGEARFKSNEEKIAVLAARLDAIKSTNEGASNTWALIALGVGIVASVVGIIAFVVSRT